MPLLGVTAAGWFVSFKYRSWGKWARDIVVSVLLWIAPYVWTEIKKYLPDSYPRMHLIPTTFNLNPAQYSALYHDVITSITSIKTNKNPSPTSWWSLYPNCTQFLESPVRMIQAATFFFLFLTGFADGIGWERGRISPQYLETFSWCLRWFFLALSCVSYSIWEMDILSQVKTLMTTVFSLQRHEIIYVDPLTTLNKSFNYEKLLINVSVSF